MNHTKANLIAVLISIPMFFSSASAWGEYGGGLWIKTTHPDPQNVSIFYVDHQAVKAMGYGRIAGKPAIWYAEGIILEGRLTLKYRYSSNATPNGWEPEGTMQLTVSKGGTRMIGIARSLSGAWSGKLEFRRIGLRSSDSTN